MNAPEKITAAEPMNAAHEILMKAASGMCSQDIAAAITGTPRPTKPQIKAAEKMLKAIHDCGMLASQPGRGGVALYSLTTPVSNINEMGDVSLANEGKTAGVCDLAQTGSGSQAEDSPISDEVRAQMQSLNTVTPDEFSLLNVIADIRAAIGDPEGKIMLGDLAAHIQRAIDALRAQTTSLNAENIALKTLNDAMPGFGAEYQAQQISSLAADVMTTRTALTHAINEADRMRSELAIERQARQALQEQINAAPPVAPRDYHVDCAGQVVMGKKTRHSAIKAAERMAKKNGCVAKITAHVPFGTVNVVKGVEFKAAKAA